MQIKFNGNLVVKDTDEIKNRNLFQTNDMVGGFYWLIDKEQNIKLKLNPTQTKILKIAMAMINPKSNLQEEYSFTVKEFMEILGVKDKTLQFIDIPDFLTNLMAYDTFRYKDVQGNFKIFHIFDYVNYNKENKVIDFRFSYSIIEKIYGISQVKSNKPCIPYTRYRLNNILGFKSNYTISLYEILKSNAYKGEFIIGVEELRTALSVPEESYKPFKELKKNVINKSVEDINKKSDLYIIMGDPIKSGRNIIAVKFIIETSEAINIKDEQNNIPNMPKVPKDENTELIQTVKAIIQENITSKDCIAILSAAKNDIELIKEKYQVVSTMSNIKNVVGSLLSAIKEDWQPPKKKVKQSTYDYKQRDYSQEQISDLERKLLGWDQLEGEEG